MANSGLAGPFNLTEAGIDAAVKNTSAGAYALGHSGDNSYIIEYVGRSDTDINARLKQWVGKYPKFKFGYYGTMKAAFEKECHLWHDFGGANGHLDNKVHPARPQNSNWSCPRCNVFS